MKKNQKTTKTSNFLSSQVIMSTTVGPTSPSPEK